MCSTVADGALLSVSCLSVCGMADGERRKSRKHKKKKSRKKRSVSDKDV